MMYYGYFRSIDTLEDPLGQQYKVEIITDFGNGDGYDYLYNDYTGNRDIPSEGTELTMCEHPFVVAYEKESGNIYKPYKCSTATVRFMLSALDENLFTNSSRRVMVALLKRNNNVVLKNGRYVDTANGEKDLGIRQKSVQTSESEAWTGYTFKDLDRALYTVEWIGFATPNVYNQQYTLTRQEFELECQDALSTLQYSRTLTNESYQSFMEFVQAAALRLGVYNNLYLSTVIYVPDFVVTSSLRRLIFNPKNFWDEGDKTYDDMLTVLAELMAAMGCTMVAHGDSLYVMQYDGIAAGNNYYHHYQLAKSSSSYFAVPGEGYYHYMGTALHANRVTLGADTFKGTNTSLSVEEVFNKITLNTEEKVPESLLPDIKDGDLMVATGRGISTETWTGSPSTRCICGVLSAMNGDIKNFLYRNSDYEIMDYSLHNCPLVGSFMSNYSGSCIVNGAQFESNANGEKKTSSKKSGFVLWSKVDNTGTMDNLPLLRLNSTLVRKRMDGIYLKGNVTFYRGYHPVAVDGDADDEPFTSTNCYMRAKVKIVTYSGRTLYFAGNNTIDSKSWRPSMWGATARYCKLPIYDEANFDEQKFDRARSFQNTDGDSGGLVIPLPNDITGSDEIMTLTVELYKHNVRESGGSATCCIFIEGLELGTVSRDGDELATENDAALVVVNDGSEIVAENEETARISSIYLNNSKGYIFQTYLDGIYWQLRNLTNLATGICGSPEVHRLANKYNQYNAAHLTISTTIHLHDGVRPWSRVVWPTQMSGKVFVVDSMEVDYEYDEVRLDLFDKVVDGTVPPISVKTYDKKTGVKLGTMEFYPTVGPKGDGWRGYTYYAYDQEEIISNFDYDRDYGTLDEAIDKRSEACVRLEPVFADDGIYAAASVPTTNVALEINEDGNLVLTQYQDGN